MSTARWEVPDLNEKGLGKVPGSQLNLATVSGKGTRPALQHFCQPPVPSRTVVHRCQPSLGPLAKGLGELVFNLRPALVPHDASVHDEELLFLAVGRARSPGSPAQGVGRGPGRTRAHRVRTGALSGVGSGLKRSVLRIRELNSRLTWLGS